MAILTTTQDGLNFIGGTTYIKTGTTTLMSIALNGNIAFNQYGAGTLVTDASGNITVSSGGGAGGPYLPLAGGDMTGQTTHGDSVHSYWGASNDLQIYHDGSNSYINEVGVGDLIIKGGNDIVFQDAVGNILANMNQSNSVELYYGGSKKFETTSIGVSVTGQLTVTNGIEMTAGNFNAGDGERIRLGNSADLQIYHDGSNSYIQDTSGTGDLRVDTSTFRLRSANGGETMIRAFEDGAVILSHNNFDKLTTTSTGVTVTGAATATTFLGDLNGTINTVTTAVTKANATNDTTVATTAFVQNLIGTIPAGLVFQGTWNAATNTPTLTSGSGTTGHFYIVSTSGSTNLDGVTDWVTGDWAVFIEQGATDAWEKIDNSSVLDGAGTGQTLPLWDGSGTSNTLTNSRFTQTSTQNIITGPGTAGSDLSINIKNSAGQVAIQALGTGEVVIPSNYLFVSSSQGAYITGTIRARGGITDDGGTLNLGGNGLTTNLTLTSNTSATFAGDVLVEDNLYLTDSGTVRGKIQLNSSDRDDLDIKAVSLGSNMKFFTVDTERMRIDSSGDIGIGVTSVDARLHITALASNGISNVKLESPGASKWAFGIPAGQTYFALDDVNDNLTTPKLVVLKTSGNVGIGTTSPSQKLDVRSGSFNSSVAQFTGANDGRGLLISTFSRGSNDDSVDYNAQYSGLGVQTWSINSSEKMRLDQNGNVGIGTTNPQNKLDVEQSAAVSARLLATGATSSSLKLEVKGGATQLTTTEILANSSGALTFATGTTSSTERMRITSSGNVGIKTTSPANPLSINFAPNGISSITTSNNSTAWNTSSAIMLEGASNSNGLGFGVSGTANDRKSWIQSGHPDQQYASNLGTLAINPLGGNVGIGTTSPGYKLHVNGGGLQTTTLTGNKISYYDGNGIGAYSSTGWGIGNYVGDLSLTNNADDKDIIFKASAGTAAAVEIMRIDGSSGNVGIGTTSPSYQLQVTGVSSDLLLMQVDDDGDAYLQIKPDASTIFKIGDIAGLSNEPVIVGSYDDLRFNNSGSTTMTVNNLNRVGIGTTSPLTKLHIAGTTDANIIRIENTATALSAGDTIGAIQFFNNDTTDDSPNVAASIYATAGASGGSGSLRFKTIEPGVEGDPATEAMIITNGGTVGIGTTSPQEKVHVSGSSNVRLEVEATDSTVAALKLTNTAGSYASFVNASGDLSTYDYNAASTRTTLLANGNLGIGTTTPGAKLDVVQATAANGAAALHLIGPNTNPGLTTSVLIIEQGDGKKITMDGNDIDVSSGDLFINDYSGEDVTFGGQIKVKGLGSPVGDSYIANGNFGIGTTSPGTKLDVRGSLRAELITLFSGSTQFLNVSSYSGNPWINTATSGGQINFGAPSSNTTNVYVQGTVEARDGLLGFVPTFVHGGFYHSSSTSSSAIYWIPSNYISETTSTQYYNRFVAPYPGRVKKVIMRWTNGATPTATSVTFRKTQNGGVSSVQFPATVTGGATTSMVATKEFSDTDFTFNAGDKYGLGFMTNGGTRFLYGMTYTLVIEYNI